jgi:O-antigen ligase
MNLSRQSFSLFVTNFAYISSIIYVPIIIANNAVTNKVLPFISLCCLFILLRNEIKLTHLMRFSVVFLLVLSSILSVGGYISLAYTLVFISLIAFVFPYYTLLSLYGEEFLKRHLKFIITVSLISIILGWMEYLYPSIVDKVFFMRGSIYLHKGQVSSLFSNPNVFGLMMAFSFQIAMLLYKNTLVVMIFFAIFLSGTLLSESRMAISIICIMFFLKIIPINKISQKLTVLIITLLALFMSLNFNLVFDLINLNLRDEIWQAAIVAFYSDPLFGIGLGQFQEDISIYASGYLEQSANNLFVGLLSELGIIGFLLFNYFWLKPILSYKKQANEHLWYQSSTLLLLLIASQFSEYMLLYVGPYVLLIVLFIAIVQWSSR